MENKTYKLMIIVSILVVLALIIIPKNPISLTTIAIGNKNYTLEKGDYLYANAWNKLEVNYNDKEYQEIPVIYQGITIGSTIEEVIDAFDIKRGYANINMEISSEEEDGMTEIIDVLYKNTKSFNCDYLDALITFGYKKVNNKWQMMKYSELEKYMDDEGEINAKKDILLFKIDINGMADENVEKEEVIMMIIQYV